MKVKGYKDTIAWYNRYAKQYGTNAYQRRPSGEIDNFVSYLPKGAKILDAGCGHGRDTHLLSEKGFDVIGLDISSGLISLARKTFPRLTFVEGNLLTLPFSDETFDGLWARASLLHFEKIQEVNTALLEFHRVLKKGGYAYILVKAQTGDKKTEVIADKVSNHDRFFRYFTKDEFKTLLESSGFDILSLTQKNELEMHMNTRPNVDWLLSLSRKKV